MKRMLLVAPDLGLVEGPGFAPGGLQSHGRMVLRALVDGYGPRSVTAWSLLDSSLAMQQALAALFCPDGLPTDGLGLSRGFGGNRLALALQLFRRRTYFDRVLFMHVGVGTLARLLPRGRHGCWLIGIEVWHALGGSRRACLAHAHPLIANSRHTTDRMRAANPWAPAADVVHLGLESDPPWSLSPDSPGTCRHGSAPTALTVGRLSAADAYKGYDTLILAWPEVIDRVPAAHLRIVGDGDDRERLEALAAGLPGGAGRHIRFDGQLSSGELREAYESSHALVLPSTKEGFGLVFLEAMRAGCACICTHGAPAEIVVPEETGLVAESTPAGIAAAVARILGNLHVAAAMGAAGRKRYEQHFTYAAFQDRFLRAWGQGG